MFGTTFCNFSEFIDYELKSKWYCLYLMISIFIPLFLLASYKNKMAQQICVSKSLLTLLLLYFFIRIVFGQLSLSNIKYIDNQLVTVIKIQMICKCKYKTI